jgi:DNA-binding NarL/FixJ family response regulator
MKTCLLCDDHAIMREAMTATIHRRWPDVTITEAADYPSAWEAATAPFDICVSDLVMPGSDPIEGIRILQSCQPQMPIIVLTGSGSTQQMLQLLEMGVNGFVSKSSSGPVIEAAINLVLAGGQYLPPELMEFVGNSAKQTPLEPAVTLTLQQSKVLAALSKGHSNKEIAREMGVAPSTIKFHVDAIFERLDSRNRIDAIGRARKMGLIGGD